MNGKKLLVADDSLTIQKVIRLALSNEGYEIHAVSDGNDAIQQIALFRPDIVLIDVSLPARSAFEVKRSINDQEEFKEVRFVLMSSAFEKVDEDEAKAVEFHGRLTKPFDPMHLRQVISDALAQVAAKRMDRTSLLMRPPLTELSTSSLESNGLDLTPPPPLPTSPSHSDEDDILWTPEEATNAGFRIDTLGPPSEAATAHGASPTLGLPLEAPPPPPAFTPSEPVDPEADIRKLTEATFRSTGLDEFAWSVSEPTKKQPLPPREEPSISPPAPTEPQLKPYPGFEDLGGTSFSLDELLQPPPPPPPGPPIAPATRAASAGATGNPDVMPIPSGQMEELLGKQIQESLETMIRQMLPEMAEKILKQEIHRMLMEQP